MGTVTADTVRRLPKAELHLHLDSGFEVEDAVRLADENKVPLLKEPADAMFEWDDLQDFLTFLDWVLSLPRNGEQVASLSYSLAQRQRRSGVSYTDVMVSPIHWKSFDGPLEEFIAAVASGLEEAERDGCPPVYLSVSISRKHSRAEAHAVLDTMLAMQHPRVAALSIDGNEALAGRTGDRFAPVFKRARANGLGVRAHAGESSGPRGRVGRDRPAQDPANRPRACDRWKTPNWSTNSSSGGTFLNVCPWSQRADGPVSRPGVPSDPGPRRRGAPGSPSTHDGSGFYRITLEDEYVTASEVYGWSSDVLRQLARDVSRGELLPGAAPGRAARGHRCL